MAYPFLATPPSGFSCKRSPTSPCSLFRSSRIHCFRQAGFGRALVVLRCAVWASSVFASGASTCSPAHEPVFAAGLSLLASLSDCPSQSSGQLARHTLERALHPQHRDAFRARFISLFLSATLGIFLARQDLPLLRQRRFHHRLSIREGVAPRSHSWRTVFLVPKTFCRRLNEPAWQLHFWITFAGVYCVLMPMHWLGRSRIHAFPRHPSASIAVAVFDSHLHTVAILVNCFRAGTVPHQFPLEPLPRKAEECNLGGHHTRMSALPPPADDFGPSDPWCIVGLDEFSVPDVAKISCAALAPSKVPSP